jgi:hypothetical protein
MAVSVSFSERMRRRSAASRDGNCATIVPGVGADHKSPGPETRAGDSRGVPAAAHDRARQRAACIARFYKWLVIPGSGV